MALAELLKFRDRLRDARYSGVRRVRDQNGEEIEYKSDSEMAKALAALEAEINSATRPKSSILTFRTSKGV